MKSVALLAILAVFTASRAAQADRELHVTVEGCAELSEREVQRLAQLELATVAGGESNEGAATAHIACTGNEASILARAPGTTRSLNRRLDLEGEPEDRARVAAIAVAQLVRALDWVPSEPAAPAPPAPPLSAPQASDRVPLYEAPHKVELEAAGGVRWRDSLHPFSLHRLSLGSSYRLSPRWALGAGLAFESGSAQRAPGEVRAQLLMAGARLKMEPWPERTLGVLARAEVGLTHLALLGRNAQSAVAVAEISGFGVGAALACGPVVRAGSFAVAVVGEGGVASFGGRALVVGDAPVNLNGAWLGAELSVRVEL